VSSNDLALLFVYTLGTGGVIGWFGAMFWRRLAPQPLPQPEILAVMRLDVRGHQITAYLDESALRDVAALAGYALVAPTVQQPSRRAH
jgi:hypothetical protein